MKISKIIITMTTLLGVLFFYSYFLRLGGVYNVYQETAYSEIWKEKCKSTAVLINNPPLSQYAQRKLWLRTKNEILEKWKPLEGHCDSLVYINNKTERAYDAGDNNYWVGDYQYCLNSALGKEQCISKDESLFFIRTWHAGGEFAGYVHGKPVYIDFMND